MSAPERHPLIIAPPHPNMDKEDLHEHRYLMWERSGGLESNSPDLKGLTASVAELNTLVGIDTRNNNTVQKQLNLKANAADLGTMSVQNADNVNITGGSITGTSIQSSSIQIQAGLTVNYLNMGGTLDTDMVAVGNTAGVETDLITYTILLNTLSQSNMYIEITAFGTIAANANLKEIKLVLGSTTLLATGSIAANSGSWRIMSKIVRVSQTSEKCISSIVSDNALVINGSNYVAASEDLGTNLIIKCTGNGVGASDIVQEGLIIEWHKF